MVCLTRKGRQMSVAATRVFADEIKELGDKFVNLTVIQAKELKDYLSEVHGIEAASGGVMLQQAPPAQEVEQVIEKTEFDVVLEGFGEKKIDVIKVVRQITGLGLKEAKEVVENAPKVVKTGVSKADAEKYKTDIEASSAGAKVSIK